MSYSKTHKIYSGRQGAIPLNIRVLATFEGLARLVMGMLPRHRMGSFITMQARGIELAETINFL